MRRVCFVFSASVVAMLASCQNQNSSDQIVSQKFIHKYGFDVTAEQWDERTQDGQVISLLKNGVKITRTFENGQLHGPTTHTFPHNETVEKLLVYDQGTLLKETLYDANGMPVREDLYESEERNMITLWDEKGIPLSVEEYENELLIRGEYYTADHTFEAKVEEGTGERVKRDRSGLLISRDKIENGLITERTSYHPTGELHTVSHYSDYQLHGEQMKYTSTGKPLMTLGWDHGILSGLKTVYRNGWKVAEIPYISGQKHGIEVHFDDLGNLTAEIAWKNDEKHGPSKFYTDETSEIEWFFQGQLVKDESKFELLTERQKLLVLREN